MKPVKLAGVTAALEHVSPLRTSLVADHAPILQFDFVSRVTGVVSMLGVLALFVAAISGVRS
jgi:hypothetical protein